MDRETQMGKNAHACLKKKPEYIKTLIGNDFDTFIGLVVRDEKDRPQAIANKILSRNIDKVIRKTGLSSKLFELPPAKKQKLNE